MPRSLILIKTTLLTKRYGRWSGSLLSPHFREALFNAGKLFGVFLDS